MEGEAETLRADVRRYNNLLALTLDALAREALDFLIARAEARLREIKTITANL